MKRKINLGPVPNYLLVSLMVVFTTMGCVNEKKKTTEDVVSKVELTLQIPGGETVNAVLSDKSVLRIMIDSILYGLAISDVDLEKKEATITFIEVVDLEEQQKVVPKDKLKIVAEKKGATGLSVEHATGVFEIQLENFSSGTINASAAGNSCCVTCGKTTSCGCKVTMSCGSCCVTPCCGQSGTSPNIGDIVLPHIDFFGK